MKVIFNASSLHGTWRAPSSKSDLIRRIAIAMQCEEESVFENVTWCNDSYTMLAIADAWGAEIKIDEGKLYVRGTKEPESTIFHAGESALCLRLILSQLARFDNTFTITAEGTLLNRPIGEIVRVLEQKGAKIKTNNGYPPVTITGPIKSGNITIEYPITSQNISGLLMALPILEGDSTMRLNKLVSLPYIQHTLKCLQQANIEIGVDQNFLNYIIKGKQQYQPVHTRIEGDWSSASLFFAASAINGNITFVNLQSDSVQADKKILDLVNVKLSDSIYQCKKQKISEFEIDITHYPDLFPALVILAMRANNPSKIFGINRLIYKESNRINAFVEEFQKFGVKFLIEGDILKIQPCEEIKDSEIQSHNDHRIAMAAAMAVVGTDATVSISDAQCVNKSYPSFWEDLECLGAKVKQIAD